MRITRLAATKHEPLAPVLPPSAAHEALVGVLGDLLSRVAGTSHPVVAMLAALQPGIVRDLAEVPEEVIRNACREFANHLQSVADAGIVAQAAMIIKGDSEWR